MNRRNLDDLWKEVEHVGKVDRLNEDAMRTLGSVFGRMTAEINRLQAENDKLREVLDR